MDSYNEDGQPSLFCAAFLGKGAAVKKLLKYGADPNVRCVPGGHTALHAASYVGSIDVLKKLLLAGGDLRLSDAMGRRPL